MPEILLPINRLRINKNNLLLNPQRKTGKYSNMHLKNRGFYNGLILCCEDYSFSEGKLCLECYKAKFFDLLSERYIKKPKMVNVNAVIKTKEKSLMLINRGEGVYGYKGYWDFPAGLVRFEEELYERLKNRILEEANIEQELLNCDLEPYAIELRGGFAGLYYLSRNAISEREILSKFKSKFPRKNLLFINKSNIHQVFDSKKRIYPQKRLFSIILEEFI